VSGVEVGLWQYSVTHASRETALYPNLRRHVTVEEVTFIKQTAQRFFGDDVLVGTFAAVGINLYQPVIAELATASSPPPVTTSDAFSHGWRFCAPSCSPLWVTTTGQKISQSPPERRSSRTTFAAVC
jgi:hypothetical protein